MDLSLFLLPCPALPSARDGLALLRMTVDVERSLGREKRDHWGQADVFTGSMVTFEQFVEWYSKVDCMMFVP